MACYPWADVYRNLNLSRKRPDVYVWSVRVGGRVRHHESRVLVCPGLFVVQPGGRRAAQQNHRRSVHAVARGPVVAVGDRVPARSPSAMRVTYNPFGAQTFTLAADGTPVYRARRLLFLPDGCWLED